MAVIEKIILILNRVLIAIGGLFLVGMCLLTCANIVLRFTWIPIRGTFELMGFMGAVVTAFALGYTRIKRGHISVTVLIDTFSTGKRHALNLFNGAVCMLFFAIAAWQVFKKAEILMNTGEVTETLRIIYYPFTFAVSLGCAVLALVLLLDMLKAIVNLKEGSHR
jgi:TRAP-type C4-dicarboxylate transport system permease small subunit